VFLLSLLVAVEVVGLTPVEVVVGLDIEITTQ
jgi:hypothetical protein